MNKVLFSAIGMALILNNLPALGETPDSPRYKTMGSAMSALQGAKDNDEKSKIYGEIGRLPLETSEQVSVLYDEVVSLEGKVIRQDQKEYIGATNYLSRVFLTARDPKFAGALAEALKKEYASMPKGFVTEGVYAAKTESDVVRYQMRMGRIENLMQAIGQSKDRQALPVLHQMLEKDGYVQSLAVTAIGQIGDPSDLDDFIKRIERDPKAHFNLNSFGPAAVDRIVQEIDDPSVAGPKGILINALRYMGAPENRATYRRLLHHSNSYVRERAAEGVCNSATKEDADLLIEIARSDLGDGRLHALQAMHKNWSTTFVPVLRDILLHGNYSMDRAEAARTLADYKVTEAIPDLKECLGDRQEEVRIAAQAALKKMQ